jgi:hypothetical protein
MESRNFMNTPKTLQPVGRPEKTTQKITVTDWDTGVVMLTWIVLGIALMWRRVARG